MVSLSRNVRQPGGGVTFFSDSLNSYHDDDPLLDSMPALPHQPAVSRWMSEEVKKYRSIRTPKAILLAKILYVCLGLSAYLVPELCKAEKCSGQDAESVVQYIHGSVWFLLLLVHLYLYHQHRSSLLHGYFSFHLETRTLRRAPLFINSGANAVMLVVTKLLDALCQRDGHCPLLSKMRYLQILITLEVLLALALLLIYLVKTLRFNKAKEAPDFLRTGLNSPSAALQSQIGYRSKSEYKDVTREAMTLLWYEVFFWKERRVRLCRDVLVLNEKLEQLGHSHKAL